MPDEIRIVVIDNHALYRQGVIDVLNAAPDITVVGEGDTADEALHLAQDTQPDVILLDIRMAGGGIEAIKTIAASLPDVRIGVLSASDNDDNVNPSLQAGAHGYVIKGVSGSTLIEAVRSVHAGDRYIWGR